MSAIEADEGKMMVKQKPKKGEFYLLMPDLEYAPEPGVVFENVKQLLTPPRFILKPDEGGFPPLRETPRLILDLAQGRHYK
ncbi:MAG: DUF1629 domain-containing protein [Xanthomonadaceae bacterium]|nr:DUF1629 domain-containing protein [Xanthomonadaceae bacterium]